MKILKKVAATSLAASLIASGIVGIPLSNNGVLGALGIQEVSAASQLPASAATLEARLNAIYAQLSSTGKQAVTNAQLQFQANINASQTAALLGPVWTKIEALATTKGKTVPEINQLKQDVFNIVTLVSGINFALGFDDLDQIRTSYYNNFVLLASITDAPNVPDFEDFTVLFNELEAQAKIILATADLSDLGSLMNGTVKNALKEVVTSSNTVTAQIIRNTGLTANEILVAKANIETAVPALVPARNAVALAYAIILLGGGNPPEEPGGTDLDPGPDTETKPPVTPEDKNAPRGIDEKELDNVLGEASKAIDDLLKDVPDITKLSDEGLQNLIATLEAAIEKIATLDVSGSVEVKGDVATAKLDDNALIKQFETISKNVDKVTEKTDGKLDQKPQVTATIDIGTTNTKTTEVTFSADLISKAKESGVDSFAVKANGVTLTFNLSDLEGGKTFTLEKQDNSTATQVTNKPLASGVFSFELGNGGPFINPVLLKLPIINFFNMDTSLLTLAKIINGRLEFFGGLFDPISGTFNASRNSFSTYTVVENKVEFNDLASVKDWAGRQVEVVAAKGIIEGRDNGAFVPNEQVTRAEFAKMIVKAYGLEDATAKENFKDVNASDWFAPYVAAAAKAGIINGRSDDQFDPNAPVSRAELATMAARALKLAKNYKDADINVALKSFADAGAIADSLKAGVALAASKGIIVGESEGEFNPNGLSTRAQAAVVLYRLIYK